MRWFSRWSSSASSSSTSGPCSPCPLSDDVLGAALAGRPGVAGGCFGAFAGFGVPPPNAARLAAAVAAGPTGTGAPTAAVLPVLRIGQPWLPL